MAINAGVNISKTVGYAVLAVPVAGSGVNISKGTGFAALSIPYGVDITKALGFAVLTSISPPVWGLTGFSSGVVGASYSSSVSVSGTTPITITTVSGSLPSGLSYAISGNIVTLSGTPTAAGTFTFTLRATNTFGIADQGFTVVIVAPSGGSYVYVS